MICLRPAKRTRFAGGGFLSGKNAFRMGSAGAVLIWLAGVSLLEGKNYSLEKADLSLPKAGSPPPADLELQAEGSALAEAMAHYASALQFESAGKMREALQHYVEVIRIDPTNAELVRHTAELAYHYQGRAEAVALLEKAAAQRPDEPSVHLNLIHFLTTYVSEDPFEKDRTSQLVNQLVERFPRRVEVISFAVLHHLAMGQRAESLALLEQASKQDIKSPQWWLELGRAAQEVWPLAQTEMREEHVKRVNFFFDRALLTAPAGAKGDASRLAVAQYYVLSNQLDLARGLCEKIVAQSGSLQARKMLFRLYEAAEEKDDALAMLEKIVQQSPDDVEQRRLLVQAYESREEWARAVPHLEAAIQIGGGEAAEYQALGQIMLQAQLYEKLLQLCERTTRLFPDNPIFQIHAAFAQRSLQRWEKAIQAMERAAAMAESGQADLVNHRFYFQFGLTLERGGRPEEAAKMFEKAITLTPKDEVEDAANTMNYLGYMWLEEGRHLDKAGELIRKANELQPDKAAYVDSLGWWYFKKGDYAHAVIELERALALLSPPEPDDAEIVEHLAQAHLKLGDKAKARAMFEKARDMQPRDPKLLKRIAEGLEATK
jgi:tetratricopeptide (TPR) repeat protein